MPSSLKKDFGSSIRELRTATGLSQEKFALQIGMDRTYYASVESGKRNISLENIGKIAYGLGVPISAIFQKIELSQEERTHD